MTKEKVAIIITRATQLVNVERNMNGMQIASLTEMLIETYWMYSLEDIQLCLDRGANGLYGEIYNRLDGSVIMGWFRKYEAERMQAIAYKRERKEQANLYDVVGSGPVLEILQDVAANLDASREPEPERQVVDIRTPFEKQLMEEFDKLPVGPNRAFRTSIYNGVELDYRSYREVRFKEEIERNIKTEGGPPQCKPGTGKTVIYDPRTGKTYTPESEGGDQ